MLVRIFSGTTGTILSTGSEKNGDIDGDGDMDAENDDEERAFVVAESSLSPLILDDESTGITTDDDDDDDDGIKATGSTDNFVRQRKSRRRGLTR
mmetsp:Transcript_25887/g.56746  ORF Transcript_25887/g.56746 Transcript_25887/m.56746 type:complete len:95 (+) Transcript_25887:420-704(+)